MRIMTENGKIFGKINIFDLIVMLLFLLLLLTAYKYIILKDWPQETQYVKEVPKEHMIVIVGFDGLSERLNNQTYVGLNHTYSDNSSFEIVTKVAKKEFNWFNVTLEARMTLVKKKEDLFLNEKLVKIDRSITIITEKIKIDGTVFDMLKLSKY